MKSLVTERVFPEASRCFNAEDAMTPWMAERTKASVAHFSLDPQNARFRAHVEAGGLGAVMDRHDTLCLYRATLRIPLVHARQIPITFDGKARFNIANALAASLASFAAGHRARRHPRRPDDVPPDAVPDARAARTSTSSATSG